MFFQRSRKLFSPAFSYVGHLAMLVIQAAFSIVSLIHIQKNHLIFNKQNKEYMKTTTYSVTILSEIHTLTLSCCK